ncbi:MAG: DUF2283 domain-containing protein [Candidatus Liptonbacteria bacterium]|nr:DUF2283 domain-containing protein [Candidatus Liptonbacteria bacterium]
MKHKNQSTISYDADSDVLAFEMSRSGKIEYAEEMGNVIVHFSKQGRPVLVEVLNASRSFRKNRELVKTLRAPVSIQ